MLTGMIFVFVLGYAAIAFEHPLKVNKAASALITAVILWVMYTMAADTFVPITSGSEFTHFIETHPSLLSKTLLQQSVAFETEHQIISSIGDIAEILLFLVGAMTIVELVDAHGGFTFITDRITTKNKKKLIWLITGLTFFMSAVLDNLTTTIVMIMLARKIIGNYKERWIVASLIVIAANSGGAWSPIGDITTIMLWVRGNVSAESIIPNLIIPCIVSTVVPVFIVTRFMKGDVEAPEETDENEHERIPLQRKERILIFALGVGCLLFVPIFKSVTHLPPFMGMILGMAVLWFATEIMYDRKKDMHEEDKLRLTKILKRIDGPTLLFFLGILMAVDALRYSGLLDSVAGFLDTSIGNIYIINLVIGLLSSIVDNVPLVAGAIGMYPVADSVMLASTANPEYLQNFAVNGVFWQFLAYCAGVGGSVLIIGSAAGVVAMGLERINFGWYMKNISLLALVGYLAGAAVYVLQNYLF
ncbi:MAG: sodium:proton antiporter NhaD [Tannerellaceae bacterium]